MTTLPRRPLRVVAGAAIALAIALLVVSLFRAIAGAAAGQGATSPADIDVAHLLRMTAIQAGLSTFISLVVGGALAWSLNRLRFPGRGLVIGQQSLLITCVRILGWFAGRHEQPERHKHLDVSCLTHEPSFTQEYPY